MVLPCFLVNENFIHVLGAPIKVLTNMNCTWSGCPVFLLHNKDKGDSNTM